MPQRHCSAAQAGCTSALSELSSAAQVTLQMPGWGSLRSGRCGGAAWRTAGVDGAVLAAAAAAAGPGQQAAGASGAGWSMAWVVVGWVAHGGCRG